MYFYMNSCFSPVAFNMLCSAYLGCYLQLEVGGSFHVLSV